MVRSGRQILLFGGWDGERDLGALWSWELPRAGEKGVGGPWRQLHEAYHGRKDVEGEKPRGRSCHAMAVDDGEGWVYMLGGMPAVVEDEDEDESDDDSFDVPIRDNSTEHRVPTPGAPSPPGAEEAEDAGSGTMHVDHRSPQSATLFDRLMGGAGPVPGRTRKRSTNASDFWRYKAVGPGRGEWEIVSGDTEADGGPGRLWDTSMVIANGSLFVFGGKADKRGEEGESGIGGSYGGLYEYNLRTKKWRLHL